MWNEEPRETELAFKVADRIISIQECEERYDYSIMDENYREIDGGVYDNPDVDIRYALLDIVDDLATHPDTNGAKGNISSDAKWVQLDFDEVSEQMDIANLPGPEVFMSRVVMEFKAKTEECFHKIGNMSATDIEERVAEYVSAKLYENDFDAEIIGVVISGSRCRGLEGKNSDLDVVVQLSGNEREDDLFNLLHEDKFKIGGVLVYQSYYRKQNWNSGRVSARSGKVSGREINADGKEAICYGRFAIEKDAGSRRKEKGNATRL